MSTTTIVEDLRSYQAKRRFPDWQPRPSDNTVPCPEIIRRCLCFLPLEMQVAAWVNESEDSLGKEFVEILRRNAEDEIKHDTVLRMLGNHYGLGESSLQGDNSLIERWKNLNCHPVLAAYTLEMGVFFTILPTLIKYGDIYAATVASWINDDERVHVESGLRIIKELKLKITKELAVLVFDTVHFIYSPLGFEIANDASERAVNRLISGKDKAMLEDNLPSTIAFFEQVDKRSIVY